MWKLIKFQVLFQFIIVSIISCNFANEDKINLKERNSELLKDSINNVRIEEKLKYAEKEFGINTKIDSLDFLFSYQFEEIIKEQKLVLIKDFIISDISQKDSLYILYIYTSGYAPKFYKLQCNPNEFKKIDSLVNSESFTDFEIEDFIIITNLSKIRKNKIGIYLDYYEYPGESDDDYSYDAENRFEVYAADKNYLKMLENSNLRNAFSFEGEVKNIIVL